MPGMKKYSYTIVAHSYTNSVDTIASNVDSLELMSFLKNIKNFIDKHYASVDIIRTNAKKQIDTTKKEETKFMYKTGADYDWVDKASKSLGLGQSKKIRCKHSFVVRYSIYKKDKLQPVFVQDYPQTAVVNSMPLFQDTIFEKMFGMQHNLRVAVLRVVDIAYDKDNPNTMIKEAPIYSRAIYPASENVPDLVGTGVYSRQTEGKYERCTPVTFNAKARTISGGEKLYFVNQPDAMGAVADVVNVIKKYGKRNLRTNGK